MRIEELYDIFLKYPSVQTDTRAIKKDDLFFALKGERFDGNTFARQALQQGAAYVIIDDSSQANDERFILVDDVLRTLQQLAKFHREQLHLRQKKDIPFLAITGSNGKTTTKELIHAALSSKYKVYTTKGNLNNHIGVPLTLLKIKDDIDVAVIEMGANHQKEIASYCEIAMPNHGLITNCGKAHLEGFGSVEGVRRGKGELFDYLKLHEGMAFVNTDDGYLEEMSAGIPETYLYGSNRGKIRGRVIESDPFLRVAIDDENDFIVNTQLVGGYNLSNVLAAIAVARNFGVSKDDIIKSIGEYAPDNSRSQLVEKGTNHFILDAYNANPSSMKAAVENFASMNAKNKILVLGSMAELGDDSQAEHQTLIAIIEKYRWDEVLLVGKPFSEVQHSFRYFPSAAEAGEWLQRKEFHNAHFLIKGSRAVAMEQVMNYL